MKKNAIVAIAVSLFVAPALAEPPTQRIAPELLRADIDIVWNAVSTGDPAFDRYRSRRELERAFQAARARVQRPLTTVEFYRALKPAIAALSNGHARLDLDADSWTWVTEEAPLIPLGTRVVDGKLYVIRDFSSEQSVPVGAEILSVNGVSARALIRTSIESMAFDGDSVAPRMDNVGGWGLIYDLALLRDPSSTYAVRYRNRGALRTVRVAGRTGSAISAQWRAHYPSDPEIAEAMPATLTWREDVADMRIPHWDHPVEGRSGLFEHYAQWFREIEVRHARALIIDIRGNHGGNENVSTELLSYLLQRPFRFYTCLSINATDFEFYRYVANADEMRAEASRFTRPASAECRAHGALEMTEEAFPNLGIQQPRQPGFAGPVFLLVDGGSFSTSSEFASVFHAQNAGVIVGQETSGGYLGDFSGLEASVRLPASGLIFNATMIAYHMATPRRRGVQGGVLPDVAVRRSVNDWISGRDVEMERALSLARRP